MYIRILLILLVSSLCNANPIAADKLFTSPDVQQVSISPDGSLVSAYIVKEKNRYLKLVDTKKMETVRTIPVGLDSRIESYVWLNDKQLFLNVIYKDQEPISIILEISLNNIAFMRPIKAKGYLVDRYKADSNKILFAKRSFDSKYSDLILISIKDLIANDFSDSYTLEHDIETHLYTFDPQSNHVFTTEYNWEDESIVVSRIPLNGGSWEEIISLENVDYTFIPEAFISENTLAVLTNKNTDKVVLRNYDIKSQSLGGIVYQHPSFDLTSAKYSDNGELISVSFFQHGLTKKQFFNSNVKRLESRILNTFSDSEYYIIDSTINGSKSLLYVNGATQPGEYFLLNHNATEAKRLFDSFSDLGDREFRPSKSFYTNSEDGMKIEAFITYPNRESDLNTLLVMPHGGPVSVKETDRFNNMVQYYASRGFSILRVNFRGSSGFGKAFQEQGVGQFGKLIEEDITRAVNHVLSRKKFKNICSIGASYGGYSSVMLAMIHPDTYDCVIGSFGVYDLQLAFNVSNYRSGEEFASRVEGQIGKYSDELKNVSPVHQYQRLKAPVLLIAGKDDDVADFEHSNRLKYLLEKSKHDVETLFFDDTGHGHSNWIGDQTEAAITYDYLIRKLGITLPPPSKLSDSGRKAIAMDYVLIADRFEFNNKTDVNKEKALTYYRVAAEYGHGRSAYNLGVAYHIGDHTSKSMKEALRYYHKAAELNFQAAHRQLGKMYMEAEFVAKDWSKAKYHLEKAVEIEGAPQNNIMLARFYCTAPEKYRDVSTCLKLMRLNQYELVSDYQRKLAIQEVSKAMPWILAEAPLHDEELKRIHSFAKSFYGIDYFNVTVEDVEAGSYVFQRREYYGDKDEWELKQVGTNINYLPHEKDRFGIRFQTDAPGINTQSETIAIPGRWIKTDSEGNVTYVRNFTLWGSPFGEWSVLTPFEKDNDTWKLQLIGWDQKILLEKEFRIHQTTQL